MDQEDQIIDATGRVAFTGDQLHPYRTSTRFRKVDGKWEPIEETKTRDVLKIPQTAEERAAGRERAKAKAADEARKMAKVRRAIVKRQSIGDPSCVQSRGEDFPLLEALRRDEREDLVAVVLRYRRLVALCEAEPLKGLDYSKADGGEVVRETKRLTPESDIDRAAASDWKEMPSGEIKISTKVKKSKGSHSIPPRRTVVAANDNVASGSVIKTESLHVKITDEILNEHIDAKPILAELRSSLGPLVEPFEDAVLGGQSYSEIGKRRGEVLKPAVAGRALVGMAIGTVSIRWQEIDRREARLAELALSRFRNRAA
ncbi:hypothetical protein [Agrobacterium pusense]|uniref:hypothetical protein n=1 Tax=Agrobacterium pusense TaxID=648995 RepID=UPI000D3607E5|nr:hypothetical protein [Agrobacterium pusense]PTV72141.1 hypothetical protein DBL06_21530 [Agrobacterium pusense]